MMEMGFVVDRIMAVAEDEGEYTEANLRPVQGEGSANGHAKESTGESEKKKKKFPPKRVGEMGELAFIQRAIREGLLVSKPWGDSDRYDAVTDWKGRLVRVQVRATEHRMGARGYAVHASVRIGKESVGLTKKEIDVLAAYIFPKDVWYIVPVEEFEPRKNLWFYPDGSMKGSKFEKFREAWHWLKRKKRPKSRIGRP